MSKIFLLVKLLLAHGEQCHFNGRNWNLDKFFFRSIENFQKFVMKNGNFSWKKKVSTFLRPLHCNYNTFFRSHFCCRIDLHNWWSIQLTFKITFKKSFFIKKKLEKSKISTLTSNVFRIIYAKTTRVWHCHSFQIIAISSICHPE